MSEKRTLVSFAAFSGVEWPTFSRPYLMGLLKDAIELEDVNFPLSVGGTVAGKYLEKELAGRIKFELEGLKPAERAERVAEVRAEFIEQAAKELANFLPKIEGKNYHIVIAQRIFDRRIGVDILEALRGIRPDIRLLGERDVGEEYDAEPKVPVKTPGFDTVRALVPYRRPWYYRIISGPMQRLINSFVSRTNSPAPNLILVGGTGTSAFLPFYEGVPSIAVPKLSKIDEQISAENMVGIVVVKVIQDGERVRLVQRTYNFKPIIAREREFAVPGNISRIEKLVLSALKQSPASLSTLVFRVNDILKKTHRERRKPLRADDIKAALDQLIAKDIVVYRRNSNWYTIDDARRSGIQVTLKDLLKDTRIVKHFVISCVHTAALKSLYRTFLRYVPCQAWDSDVIFEVGDETQDLAHNYEYNGELLPSLVPPDKQEIMAGALRARMLLKIFAKRLSANGGARLPLGALLEKCLITYVFTPGNHPGWKHYRKGALILKDFESELKDRLIRGIIAILAKEGRTVDFEIVSKAVDAKIIRVGENGIVTVDGVTVGVKHPSKARTESKSHRIQDAVSFLWRTFNDLVARTAKKTPNGFALVYVANFHEMASVYVSKFGKTILGVMSGAYLKDTQFETSKDKVVDYGFTKVTACINPQGDLVYSDVEFDNWMHPEDAKFVFADRIMTSDILKLEKELNEVVDIPWR